MVREWWWILIEIEPNSMIFNKVIIVMVIFIAIVKEIM